MKNFQDVLISNINAITSNNSPKSWSPTFMHPKFHDDVIKTFMGNPGCLCGIFKTHVAIYKTLLCLFLISIMSICKFRKSWNPTKAPKILQPYFQETRREFLRHIENFKTCVYEKVSRRSYFFK